MEKEFLKKLVEIQSTLKAPKNLRNTFGNYNYRNAEGILEAVKPLLKQHDLILTLTDKVECIGQSNYIVATAAITDGIDRQEVSAYARESVTKKGMDDSQITGTASSYARKYALNGLFLLDDTKDADSNEYHEQTNQKPVQKPQQQTEEEVDHRNEYISESDKNILKTMVEKRGYTVEQFFPNGLNLTKEQYVTASQTLEKIKVKEGK